MWFGTFKEKHAWCKGNSSDRQNGTRWTQWNGYLVFHCSLLPCWVSSFYHLQSGEAGDPAGLASTTSNWKVSEHTGHPDTHTRTDAVGSSSWLFSSLTSARKQRKGTPQFVSGCFCWRSIYLPDRWEKKQKKNTILHAGQNPKLAMVTLTQISPLHTEPCFCCSFNSSHLYNSSWGR